MLDVLRDRVGPGTEVTYAPGYDPLTGATDPALRDEALAAAAGADVVVVCAGLPAPMESEGFDRTTLDLPDGHVTLIEALAAQAAPVVVVLSNGGAVHLPWADRVAAVLECWLGGQAGAGAIVDLLVGDAEPGRPPGREHPRARRPARRPTAASRASPAGRSTGRARTSATGSTTPPASRPGSPSATASPTRRSSGRTSPSSGRAPT